ncbi:hypothetical protein [Glaciihabitans sp. dw_435]|uniref:hypothetical protein n=1 Tax=Glaciihabitans sp. dw_435 TaxID=2720081 RepID=UPI001BD6371E|nr:hypothetical protein [Glaciihabitans sp. dw_435]
MALATPRTVARNAARLTGLIEFIFRRTDRSGDIFPADASVGIVDGLDPERVFVFGESNAVGLGVLTHELGFVGQFSRKRAASVRRGAYWSAAPVPGHRIAGAPAFVTENVASLADANVVIVMLGITDTLMLTKRASWTQHMTELVDGLLAVVPARARILLTEIPPMDNAGSISPMARLAAGHQARMFNAATRRIVADRPQTLTVRFPQELRQKLWVPESRETSYAHMYAVWARAAVETLAADDAFTARLLLSLQLGEELRPAAVENSAAPANTNDKQGAPKHRAHE